MTFHADFWVAIATAAPVIALAATVQITDNLKLGVRATTAFASTPIRKIAQSYITRAQLVFLTNLTMQTFALLISLQSLLTDDNYIPPEWAIWSEATGLLALVATALLQGRVEVNIEMREASKRRLGTAMGINKETD